MMMIIIIIIIIENKDDRNMRDELIDTEVQSLKNTFVKITKKPSKDKNVEIEVRRMWRRMKTETELVDIVLWKLCKKARLWVKNRKATYK